MSYEDDGVMVEGQLYCCVHHAQQDLEDRQRKERRQRALELKQLRKDDERKAQRKARNAH